MAVPVVQSAAAAAGNSITATISKPSGVVSGDHLFAFVSARQRELTIDSSGWTEVFNGAGEDIEVGVWYKLAGGSEPASYDWTIGGSGPRYWSGIIVRVSGADSSPVDAHAAAYEASGTSHTSPAVTATGDDRLILRFCAGDSTANDTSTPSGHTLIAYQEASGILSTACLVYKEQASSGSSGTATFTFGADDEAYMVTVAVKPPSPAGHEGALSTSFANFTLSSAGTFESEGSLSASFADFVLEADGSFNDEAAEAELSASFADFALSAAGAFESSSSLSASFAGFLLAAEGLFDPSSAIVGELDGSQEWAGDGFVIDGAVARANGPVSPAESDYFTSAGVGGGGGFLPDLQAVLPLHVAVYFPIGIDPEFLSTLECPRRRFVRAMVPLSLFNFSEVLSVDDFGERLFLAAGGEDAALGTIVFDGDAAEAANGAHPGFAGCKGIATHFKLTMTGSPPAFDDEDVEVARRIALRVARDFYLTRMCFWGSALFPGVPEPPDQMEPSELVAGDDPGDPGEPQDPAVTFHGYGGDSDIYRWDGSECTTRCLGVPTNLDYDEVFLFDGSRGLDTVRTLVRTGIRDGRLSMLFEERNRYSDDTLGTACARAWVVVCSSSSSSGN